MNYLAHLLLSDGTSESIVGNLLADFVKGNELAALPAAIQSGVRLHRSIDSFTDAHPVTRRSRARFGRDWSRFSGILVDVYYDHLLADSWSHHCETGLRDMLDNAYNAIRTHFDCLGTNARLAGGRLISADFMASYADLAGIVQALERLSRRLRKGQFQLERSVDVFLQHRDALNADFLEFFPQLRDHAKSTNTVSLI